MAQAATKRYRIVSFSLFYGTLVPKGGTSAPNADYTQTRIAIHIPILSNSAGTRAAAVTTEFAYFE